MVRHAFRDAPSILVCLYNACFSSLRLTLHADMAGWQMPGAVLHGCWGRASGVGAFLCHNIAGVCQQGALLLVLSLVVAGKPAAACTAGLYVHSSARAELHGCTNTTCCRCARSLAAACPTSGLSSAAWIHLHGGLRPICIGPRPRRIRQMGRDRLGCRRQGMQRPLR